MQFSLDTAKLISNLTEKPYLPFISEYEDPNRPDFIRHDSTTQGQWHFYRVLGLNHFGQSQNASEWKKIYVPYLINAYVDIDTVGAKDDYRFIEVHVEGLSNKPININEIVLLMSTKKDNGFVEIERRAYKQRNERFEIKGYTTGDAYFYKAIAINQDQDTASSLPYYFFTLDQEPPQPAEQLEGLIDSLGRVNLTWEQTKDDDIMGFRVFRANTKSEEFVEQTRTLLGQPIFFDTLPLNNLSSDIYYFVQVVDQNYNNSVPSDTILVIKPDTIPPVPAHITAISFLDAEQKLRIKWIASSSEDVARIAVIRKINQQIDTLLLATNGTDSLLFQPMYGVSSAYTIATFDKSNNVSISPIFHYKFEPGYRPKLDSLTALSDRQNGKIVLSWGSAVQENVFSYEIYRGQGKGAPVLLQTIDAATNPTKFEDTKTSPNNAYTYHVKYITASGIHSIPAEVKVVY